MRSSRVPRRLTAALALLLAAGCASSRYQTLSPSATVLPTPLVEQDQLHECGLAALSSLCGFYQVPIPDAERQQLAQLAAQEQGLTGAELRESLQRLGFDVWIFEGTFDRTPTGVLHHVEQGRPLMVMTCEHDQNHFCLLIGHDPELGNVVLLDPRRGRVLLPDETFEQEWNAVRHFTLLAVPASTKGVAQASPLPGVHS